MGEMRNPNLDRSSLHHPEDHSASAEDRIWLGKRQMEFLGHLRALVRTQGKLLTQKHTVSQTVFTDLTAGRNFKRLRKFHCI